MSSIAFSGLATGLDTGSIIAQLVEIKRQPIYRLEDDKAGFQKQITALGTLKTKLLALQTAAQDLDTAGEFSSLRATSSDEDLLTATAGDGAAPGTHDIVVKTLAKAQKEISQGFDNNLVAVGEGTISFTVDGVTTELALSGYTSLDSLKNLINDNVEGVGASIVYDGSTTGGYKLVLSGTEAGTAGAFTADFSGLTGGTAPVLTTQQAAADATLTVDGIDVVATSNTPDDVISGLTLDLKNFDLATTVQITVTLDSEGIADKVKAMVDAYNDLYSYISEQSKPGADLRGNPTLSSVASRMESIFSTSLEDGLGSVTSFYQVGVSRGTDRQLEFDEEEFAEALEADFGGVRDFFIEREGNLGKMYLVDTAIEDMTDSIDGLFKISTDSLNRKIDYTDESIERYERSVAAYQTTLERQYTAMEMMVAQLQAQGNYLSSIVTY